MSFSNCGHCKVIWELLHSDWIGYITIQQLSELQDEYARYIESAKLKEKFNA